ncbi:MAG: hypothetical protein IT385_15625 [Deltaproteobacteria bacterium]|nr:hypothetical protein [Deltaproteobacteria bacterium]
MFFVVHHRISNVAEFWGAAQRELPNLPAGIAIIAVYPNAAGDDATCVWQSDSQERLSEYLELHTGAHAQNSYMPIDASKAMGLPTA